MMSKFFFKKISLALLGSYVLIVFLTYLVKVRMLESLSEEVSSKVSQQSTSILENFSTVHAAKSSIQNRLYIISDILQSAKNATQDLIYSQEKLKQINKLLAKKPTYSSSIAPNRGEGVQRNAQKTNALSIFLHNLHTQLKPLESTSIIYYSFENPSIIRASNPEFDIQKEEHLKLLDFWENEKIDFVSSLQQKKINFLNSNRSLFLKRRKKEDDQTEQILILFYPIWSLDNKSLNGIIQLDIPAKTIFSVKQIESHTAKHYALITDNKKNILYLDPDFNSSKIAEAFHSQKQSQFENFLEQLSINNTNNSGSLLINKDSFQELFYQRTNLTNFISWDGKNLSDQQLSYFELFELDQSSQRLLVFQQSLINKLFYLFELLLFFLVSYYYFFFYRFFREVELVTDETTENNTSLDAESFFSHQKVKSFYNQIREYDSDQEGELTQPSESSQEENQHFLIQHSSILSMGQIIRQIIDQKDQSVKLATVTQSTILLSQIEQILSTQYNLLALEKVLNGTSQKELPIKTKVLLEKIDLFFSFFIYESYLELIVGSEEEYFIEKNIVVLEHIIINFVEYFIKSYFMGKLFIESNKLDDQLIITFNFKGNYNLPEDIVLNFENYDLTHFQEDSKEYNFILNQLFVSYLNGSSKLHIKDYESFVIQLSIPTQSLEQENKELAFLKDPISNIHTKPIKRGSVSAIFRRYRIFLIDEDSTFLKKMYDNMDQDIYEIDVFKSPRQALKTFKVKPPDYILFTTNYGDLNTFDFAKLVHSNTKNNHVRLGLYGENFKEIEKEYAYYLGIDHIFEKPLNLAQISNTMQQHYADFLVNRKTALLKAILNDSVPQNSNEEKVLSIIKALKSENGLCRYSLIDAENNVKYSSHEKELEQSLEKKVFDVLADEGNQILIETSQKLSSHDLEFLEALQSFLSAPANADEKSSSEKITFDSRSFAVIAEINAKLKEIIFIKASNQYVEIYYEKKESYDIQRCSLKQIHFLLNDHLIQVNRSTLVNRKYIKNLIVDGKNYKLELKSQFITISPNYIENIKDLNS